MSHEFVISYPHMGSYAAVFRQLLGHLFPGATVLSPPPITRRTVELGGRHSPDFVCSPFKYNLGNYIEALEQGANLLFQTGNGCRYGYYGELQEQILRDLGYDFTFVCLSRGRTRAPAAVRTLKLAGSPLPVHKMAGAFALASLGFRVMDRFEYWMRENIGFEAVPGSCEAAQQALIDAIEGAHSFADLYIAAAHSRKAMRNIRLERPEDPLRVGVVGELYTLMEPFSNFQLERQLAREGMVVSRAMGVWFLLFGRDDRRALRQSGGYLCHPVGANGVDTIAQSLGYARQGYDGILHIKSFGCIPELNAAPALTALSRDEGIPVLQLSFDAHTSETGVETRIEAFADMLRMRREETHDGIPEPRRGYRFGLHQGGGH